MPPLPPELTYRRYSRRAVYDAVDQGMRMVDPTLVRPLSSKTSELTVAGLSCPMPRRPVPEVEMEREADCARCGRERVVHTA